MTTTKAQVADTGIQTPWHVEESSETVRDANGHLVCCAIAGHDIARLIAAAPETAAERDRLKEINAELLDLLQDARDSLYHANNCASEAPGIKQPCNCGFNRLTARIDAAISRATVTP